MLIGLQKWIIQDQSTPLRSQMGLEILSRASKKYFHSYTRAGINLRRSANNNGQNADDDIWSVGNPSKVDYVE
jgi:hypothetical protein